MLKNPLSKEAVTKSRIIVFSFFSFFLIAILFIIYTWWDANFNTRYLNCGNFSLTYHQHQKRKSGDRQIVNFEENGKEVSEIGTVVFSKVGINYQRIYIPKPFPGIKKLVNEYGNCFTSSNFYLEVNPQADSEKERYCVVPGKYKYSEDCTPEQLRQFGL